MGSFPKGISGLGNMRVNGSNLVPLPPAIIMTGQSLSKIFFFINSLDEKNLYYL